MVQLLEDERLDRLYAHGDMKIIQSPAVFSFSLDAVLLANFAGIPRKKGKILDLCTGNGVIPLMLARKTKAKITGIEIQDRLVDMAERSVRYNGLDEQISIIHEDLNKLQPLLGHSQFDAVTCNPPYFKTTALQERNKNKHFLIARHEVYCTLEDVMRACKLHVRPGGRVSFVHRPGRMIDLLTLSRKYRLEPKRIQFVYPKKGREANMILLECIRDGKPDVKLLPSFYVYEEDGTYTEEARTVIYDGE